MSIASVESLKKHLQFAIQIEHATLPPYLCALYTLKDESSEAYDAIRSVAMEEMLHSVLGCNLLNAIGGAPSYSNPNFIPRYPAPLPQHNPDPPLVLHLERCSIELIRDIFMRIEQPEAPSAPPEDEKYDSLGQFYKAIEIGFQSLSQRLGERALFCGDPSRQLHSGYWGSGGKLISVENLESSFGAINEIVEQGEGSTQTEVDEDGELAHFWKFKHIVDGKTPLGDVYPMAADPSTAALPDGPVRELSTFFNGAYGLMLRKLTEVVNGHPWRILSAIQLMKNVLKPTALLLLQSPVESDDPQGARAGPSFEYAMTGRAQLSRDCELLQQHFPPLAEVGEVLRKLPSYDRG